MAVAEGVEHIGEDLVPATGRDVVGRLDSAQDILVASAGPAEG